jgi:hypothetical protein
MESHEIEREMSRELGRDERLLWSGQPRQGVMFRASDVLMVPFSLLWCGFAVFWEVSVFRTNAPFFFRLWGVPFVCVGLYMVFGRFIADAVNRKRTAYGVTNERVIMITGRFARATTSVRLNTISAVSLNERPDGTGTITLGATNTTALMGPNWSASRQTSPPALEGIQNARAVYEQVRQAQKAA